MADETRNTIIYSQDPKCNLHSLFGKSDFSPVYATRISCDHYVCCRFQKKVFLQHKTQNLNTLFDPKEPSSYFQRSMLGDHRYWKEFYHHSPIQSQKIWSCNQNTRTSRVLLKMGRNQNSHTLLLGDYKMVQPLWKIVWQFLKKLNTELPYSPVIPLLSI